MAATAGATDDGGNPLLDQAAKVKLEYDFEKEAEKKEALTPVQEFLNGRDINDLTEEEFYEMTLKMTAPVDPAAGTFESLNGTSGRM